MWEAMKSFNGFIHAVFILGMHEHMNTHEHCIHESKGDSGWLLLSSQGTARRAAQGGRLSRPCTCCMAWRRASRPARGSPRRPAPRRPCLLVGPSVWSADAVQPKNEGCACSLHRHTRAGRPQPELRRVSSLSLLNLASATGTADAAPAFGTNLRQASWHFYPMARVKICRML